MNNNIFVHLYSKVVHSKDAAHDFFHEWKSVIVSTKSRTCIVEFTMTNNDIHVFLSDISYSHWCLGRTYYMCGILYHSGYPCYTNKTKEKNMENHYTDMEIEKLRKDAYETAMEEAHEAMNELYNLDYDTCKSIFGYGHVDEVIKKYDIRTIIGKLYAYKQTREMIGKEYIRTDNKQKVIVTGFLDFPRGKYIYFLRQCGTSDYLPENEFGGKYKETGKSYPGLVAFLDKAEGSKS